MNLFGSESMPLVLLRGLGVVAFCQEKLLCPEVLAALGLVGCGVLMVLAGRYLSQPGSGSADAHVHSHVHSHFPAP